MRVEIRTGGDGVQCWNDQAIRAHADQTTQREARLSASNPDLVVIPGTITCYGCETQEYGYGMKCTAQITKTLYTVAGEVQPRPADAVGWHREIPGLQTIRPEDADETQPGVATAASRPTGGATRSPGPAPQQAGAPEPAPSESAHPLRAGARRLFGRG